MTITNWVSGSIDEEGAYEDGFYQPDGFRTDEDLEQRVSDLGEGRHR
jgi:hypothetical protein